MYLINQKDGEIKNALQIIHNASARCTLMPKDAHGVKLFKTRRGCITPAMAYLFDPCCADGYCEGCVVPARAMLPGGLLHEPDPEICDVLSMMSHAEYELNELRNKMSKSDTEHVASAIRAITSAIDMAHRIERRKYT